MLCMTTQECPICLDDIRRYDNVAICFQCSIQVHEKCHRAWQKKNSEWPARCVYCQTTGNLYLRSYCCCYRLVMGLMHRH